jgi:hypothetical protein
MAYTKAGSNPCLPASFITFDQTFSAGMKFDPRSITPQEETSPKTKVKVCRILLFRLTRSIKHHLYGQARILGQRPLSTHGQKVIG